MLLEKKYGATGLNSMYKFHMMLILLFLAGLTVLNAQEVQFIGTVRDSLQDPLSGANLIALPISGEAMKFSISDDRGRFKLALQKKILLI